MELRLQECRSKGGSMSDPCVSLRQEVAWAVRFIKTSSSILDVGGVAGNLPIAVREAVAAEVGITRKQLTQFLGSEKQNARKGDKLNTAAPATSGSAMSSPTTPFSAIGATLRPVVPPIDSRMENLRKREQLREHALPPFRAKCLEETDERPSVFSVL